MKGGGGNGVHKVVTSNRAPYSSCDENLCTLNGGSCINLYQIKNHWIDGCIMSLYEDTTKNIKGEVKYN